MISFLDRKLIELHSGVWKSGHNTQDVHHRSCGHILSWLLFSRSNDAGSETTRMLRTLCAGVFAPSGSFAALAAALCVHYG